MTSDVDRIHDGPFKTLGQWKTKSDNLCPQSLQHSLVERDLEKSPLLLLGHVMSTAGLICVFLGQQLLEAVFVCTVKGMGGDWGEKRLWT